MGKWLAAFSEKTQDTHDPCTDVTDSRYKKYVPSVLSVRHSLVNDEKTQGRDSSESERWDPELADEGYVWCQDCQFFNGFNCDSNDNPFMTVEKQPAVARKCQWYAEKP